MSFQVVYPVGGQLEKIDKITSIDKIEQIGPDHIFPAESEPYIKGMRLEIDQTESEDSLVYALPAEMVLVSVSIHASGYGDGDFWEAFYDLGTGVEKQFIETCYTKEVPETFPMVGFLGGKKLPGGSTVRIRFVNATQTYKTVWFTLRFLRKE